MQCQRKQCLMDIQSKTQQSTTNYYAKALTVSDDQLSVGWRWESVDSFHSLPFPSSPFHSDSHETS